MIGLAVIGLGNALVPHARAIADLSDRCRVVWAVAREPSRLEAIGAEHGWKVTTDLGRAVQDKSVDAVMILTHPDTHRVIAEQAFATGKHVLCEKPLAASVAEAEALVASGRRADRRLGVVLQMRVRPGALRLRAALASGELGEVQAAAITVPWWRPQAYYDQPGRGTARAGRRRRVDDPGHSHARSVQFVAADTRGRRRDYPHHRAAPHGNRGLGRRPASPGERRPGDVHRQHRVLPGQRRSASR